LQREGQTCQERRVARKFLYVIAFLIALVLAAGVIWSLFGMQLIRWVSVPSTPFVAPKPIAVSAYAKANMWAARPDLAQNPALWLPTGAAPPVTPGKAAVFFIHPTSFLLGKTWNAALDDTDTNDRTTIFIKGQASAFSAAGAIWAPKYRQASFGAFLTDKPEATKAISAAYEDVAQAFEVFLKENSRAPIILAGHSQGALHLTRLLRDRIAGTPLEKRIIAAYVIGWPISVEADLPALGLAACATPTQRGCILSWQSFAEPADVDDVMTAFAAQPGLTGFSRKDSHILCTNPINGMINGDAPAAANLGTLKNSADFTAGELLPAAVPARCDDRGILLIGPAPDMGPYVLPGNNYHVYDYSLFWANIRADSLQRLNAR
jgi:Protein of unknown function (DUF3089)